MKTIILLNDEKIYHVGDVLENFSNYFGFSFDELQKLLSNYQIIEKEELIKYIIENPEKMAENQFYRKKDIKAIAHDRTIDYCLLTQKLLILQHKGMNYLSLLQYVANIPDVFHEDEFFELIFETFNISHFGKGMLGRHLKQLLTPLTNIVKEMQITIEQINNLETYHRQTFDSFARSYGEDKFYAVDNVICNEDSIIVDKTSFDSTRQNKRTRKII